MFSSGIKVQNYRKLLQMTETSPSGLRNDALGLDLRVQRKLFESSPAQTLKKKRNFGEMMTTHRYEDILEPTYTPRITRSEREPVYLPSRDEICAAKRIDMDLCSSNLVFGAPEETEEEALREFRDVMQGEIQAGQLVEISTTEVLSATKNPPAWRVHRITDWYSEMLGDINTKLENNGHVRIPKADAKPMPLPGESCQTNEAFTWKARFGEHCNKYSAEAYQIFCKLEINYPVVPKPEILAKYMSKMGFDDKDVTTSDDIELCIRKWTIENLPSSTQNRTYHEAIQWLAAQLRTAAQEVPVLNNTLLNIEPLDVLGVMDAVEAHYQKLDDFGKWCISKSIKCLEIQDKQTLRMFKDLLVRAAIALK